MREVKFSTSHEKPRQAYKTDPLVQNNDPKHLFSGVMRHDNYSESNVECKYSHAHYKAEEEEEEEVIEETRGWMGFTQQITQPTNHQLLLFSGQSGYFCWTNRRLEISSKIVDYVLSSRKENCRPAPRHVPYKNLLVPAPHSAVPRQPRRMTMITSFL